MPSQGHSARPRCRRGSLVLALLCLACVFLDTHGDSEGQPRCSHPDEVAVSVRFRVPHFVVGCATELDVTASGLVQGVTYTLKIVVARLGDVVVNVVHQDEASITWSSETGAQGASHSSQHVLPPLSGGGPHTLRVTVIDTFASSPDEAMLATAVRTVNPLADGAGGACAAHTHLQQHPRVRAEEPVGKERAAQPILDFGNRIGEHRCVYLPWNDRAEAVQGNMSMLALKRAGGSDTGWFAELDARFSREPPIYGDGDESIGIDCSLTIHPGAQAERKPPVPLGSRVRMRVSFNVLQNRVTGLEVELLPLVAISDGIASMMTFQHIIVGMDKWQDNAGVRCHGPVTTTVELVDFEWGTLSSDLTFMLEDSGQVSPLDDRWPVAPRGGRLGHCLSEVHYDYNCWRHIRQRLLGVPIFATQTELMVLAMSSPSFFRQDNTAAFRSRFPVHDEGRTQRFKTCAVVGSAGHLLNSSLGRDIDAHEMVMRFNEAPTAGFERDVGARTTHRLLPGLGATPHIHNFIEQSVFPQREREQLIFVPNQHETRSGIEEFLFWRGRANGNGVHLLSISFVHFVFNILGSRYTDKVPTTGFYGLVWALDACEQLDTYGMGHLRDAMKVRFAECKASPDCNQSLPASASAGDAQRHAYAYYARKNPRPWSYNHKFNSEDRQHWAWHREGALHRHFDR